MKPIAIITATPPGINPGMLAGEASARATLARAGLLGDTTFYRLVTLDERLAAAGPAAAATIAACDVGIRHVRLDDPAVLDRHVTLFWGDFLHMRRYITALAGGDPPREAAYRGVLLLADRPDATCRSAVSYGTSLLFNSTADESAPEYASALERFLGAAAHVQMRDAVSAARVSRWRSGSGEPCGVDPAQLMAVPEIAAEMLGGPVPVAAGEESLVYFARSRHRPDDLIAFVTELGAAVGVGCRWLPWGDRASFPFVERDLWPWPTAELPAAATGSAGVLPSLLAAVAASRYVVTDTYHVAVSSWALGVPAIVVLGDYHEAERHAKQVDVRLRLDKRTQLLGQDGLLDYGITPGLLEARDRRAVIVERLAPLLVEGRCGPAFRRTLAVRAAASAAALLAALDEVRRR